MAAAARAGRCLAGRRSAHARPRRAGLPRGLFRQLGFAVWDEHWYAGPRPARLQPAVPAAGLAARAAARWPRCRCSPRRRCSSVSTLTVYGRAARWAAAWFAVAAVARHLDRAGRVRAGRLVRARGGARARSRPPAARGRARGAVRGGEPRGGRAARAGRPDATRSHRRSPRALAQLWRRPRRAVVARSRCCSPKAAPSPIRSVSFAATVLVVAGVPAGRCRPASGCCASARWCTCSAACCASRAHADGQQHRALRGAAGRAAAAVCARRSLGAPRGRARGGDRAMTPGAALGALALCIFARVGAVGAGARDARGGGQRIDERLLLRAGRALPRHAPGAPVRVEVPLTRSHWEAALLAPTVSLARGWEKQLDKRYDRVLLAPGLTAAAYRALAARAGGHLRRAAGRAARPLERSGGPPDPRRPALPARGVREPALADLRRALAPTPLRAGPGRLTALGHDSFALRARLAGKLPRARALHPLLYAHRGRRLRRAGAGGLDVGDRPRARGARRRRALLARARAGPAGLLRAHELTARRD